MTISKLDALRILTRLVKDPKLTGEEMASVQLAGESLANRFNVTKRLRALEKENKDLRERIAKHSQE